MAHYATILAFSNILPFSFFDQREGLRELWPSLNLRGQNREKEKKN